MWRQPIALQHITTPKTYVHGTTQDQNKPVKSLNKVMPMLWTDSVDPYNLKKITFCTKKLRIQLIIQCNHKTAFKWYIHKTKTNEWTVRIESCPCYITDPVGPWQPWAVCRLVWSWLYPSGHTSSGGRAIASAAQSVAELHKFHGSACSDHQQIQPEKFKFFGCSFENLI